MCLVVLPNFKNGETGKEATCFISDKMHVNKFRPQFTVSYYSASSIEYIDFKINCN